MDGVTRSVSSSCAVFSIYSYTVAAADVIGNTRLTFSPTLHSTHSGKITSSGPFAHCRKQLDVFFFFLTIFCLEFFLHFSLNISSFGDLIVLLIVFV